MDLLDTEAKSLSSYGNYFADEEAYGWVFSNTRTDYTGKT